MSTLNAFGFNTQKHAPKQHERKAKEKLLITPLPSTSTQTSQPVPWLLSSPPSDSKPQQSLPQKPSLNITINKTKQSTHNNNKSNNMSRKRKTQKKSVATAKNTSITQYFTSKQESNNMEIDGNTQPIVRKQLSFEQLWQRLVKEYASSQQDNHHDDNNENIFNSRRRKYQVDDDDEACCAVIKQQQANKKTKFTVDHEFLLKFQQLFTVDHPTLYKSMMIENMEDGDDKEEEEKNYTVMIRRQLTIDESIDLMNQIMNELLL